MPRRLLTQEALCHIPQPSAKERVHADPTDHTLLRRHRRPVGARAREGTGIGASSLPERPQRREYFIYPVARADGRDVPADWTFRYMDVR
jgi:hypothetical protein